MEKLFPSVTWSALMLSVIWEESDAVRVLLSVASSEAMWGVCPMWGHGRTLGGGCVGTQVFLALCGVGVWRPWP